MAPRTLITLLVLAASALAQDGSTGAIRGTITDPSHAAIANAHITIAGLSTGIVRNTETDGQGAFVFDLLPPADYSLTVSFAGMAEYKVADIKVDVGGIVN